MFWKGDLEWSQCFWGNNPGADRGAEVLSVEWTEWHVFPDLHVTSTPIVKQAEAENVIFCLINCHWIAKIVWCSDKSAHFEFQVESFAS